MARWCLVAVLLAGGVIAGSAQTKPWPCPRPPIEPCFTHHGRLSSQNGIALKIWLIGTTRVVGLDNDEDHLPAWLGRYLDMASPDHGYVYGDFEICPTSPDRQGHMRRVCVRGAERLVVQDVAGVKPPFRIRSTWPGTGGGREPVIVRRRP